MYFFLTLRLLLHSSEKNFMKGMGLEGISIYPQMPRREFCNLLLPCFHSFPSKKRGPDSFPGKIHFPILLSQRMRRKGKEGQKGREGREEGKKEGGGKRK
jgi:hypothetical protein